MTNRLSTEGRDSDESVISSASEKSPLDSALCLQARVLAVLVSLLLFGSICQAQPTFTTNSLPCQIGQYNRSYFCSNIDVSGLLSLTTNVFNLGPQGPFTNIDQFWDFSWDQQTNESVLRVDIVPASAGGYASSFPNASYAEQNTFEPSNILGWQYYGFCNGGPNPGRLYYGLDEPCFGVTPQAVFTPPAVDIPTEVQFNQTWSNSLYWLTLYFQTFVVSNSLSCTAAVDAYGVLLLPQIGAVSALRIHQVNSYALTVLVPFESLAFTNDDYFWVVPGLGIAAQIEVYGNTPLPPSMLPYTNTFQRMFFANYFTNPIAITGPKTNFTGPPTDLQAQIQSNLLILNWSYLTNCTNYRVDFSPSISPPNWNAVGFTTNTSWTNSPVFQQGFYRVSGNPP